MYSVCKTRRRHLLYAVTTPYLLSCRSTENNPIKGGNWPIDSFNLTRRRLLGQFDGVDLLMADILLSASDTWRILIRYMRDEQGRCRRLVKCRMHYNYLPAKMARR